MYAIVIGRLTTAVGSWILQRCLRILPLYVVTTVVVGKPQNTLSVVIVFRLKLPTRDNCPIENVCPDVYCCPLFHDICTAVLLGSRPELRLRCHPFEVGNKYRRNST